MTTIAVTATKGSPGATTLALALCASATTQSPALFVEADPSGGDIALRCGVAFDPGLATLAASGRHRLDRTTVDAHAQLLPSGVMALLAPTSADHAASALASVGAALGQALAHASSPTIIDAGRWDPHSPAAELVAAASVAVLVLRPSLEGVEHARCQLASLATCVEGVIAVCIGERPYPSGEVRSALGVDALYVVADDARAANAVGTGARPDRWQRRSSLMRSASTLADLLLGHDEASEVRQ